MLQEFLTGVNVLSYEAAAAFFAKDTKVGGILSGGSVYVQTAKKVVSGQFARRAQGGQIPEAQALFSRAEAYSREHNIPLQPGWQVIGERMQR